MSQGFETVLVSRAAVSDLHHDERAFSLIEFLIVFAVIGIIANIAIPAYVHAQLRTRATAIMTDFVSVRNSAQDYYNQNHVWPPDRGAGREPPEFSSYLQGRVRWNQDDVRYDWQNWVKKDGQPNNKAKRSGVTVGFSVRTKDKKLLAMLENVWGNPLNSTYGWGVTFPIVGTVQ